MEVLIDSDSPILISNAEILALLDKKVTKRREKLAMQNQGRRKQRETKPQHREWIEEKVWDYLKNSPCVNVDVSKIDELQSILTSSKRRRQLVSDPTSAVTGTSSKSTNTSFGLTQAEAIQIVNFLPSEPVEIHLMVEELHDRMTEASQEELLKCIAAYRKDTEL